MEVYQLSNIHAKGHRLRPLIPISDTPEGAVSLQVCARIRDQIIRGSLVPAQRLSETEVASSFDVSRQPVREAFIRLAAEGLLEIRPQRGTYVRRISVASALTTRLIREAVEVELIRMLVPRITTADIESLRQQIAQQEDVATKGSPADFILLDEAFHRHLAEAAGAPDVSDYLEALNVQMNRVRNMTVREFAPDILVAQHRAIVDALEAGDAKAAETAIRRHLRQFNIDLPTIVASYPDYFKDTDVLTSHDTTP